ncbi:UNVERIFIED_CONTAM: hypothetical protein LBW93_05555 [Wolbachia endosymbiont of Nasonia longicornis]
MPISAMQQSLPDSSMYIKFSLFISSTFFMNSLRFSFSIKKSFFICIVYFAKVVIYCVSTHITKFFNYLFNSNIHPEI